jgi:hypothetical protein
VAWGAAEAEAQAPAGWLEDDAAVVRRVLAWSMVLQSKCHSRALAAMARRKQLALALAGVLVACPVLVVLPAQVLQLLLLLLVSVAAAHNTRNCR